MCLTYIISDEFFFFGEKNRYREILHACALDVDISLMIGNDLSYIGEKGINLSGGQRSRLAFARLVCYFQESAI